MSEAASPRAAPLREGIDHLSRAHHQLSVYLDELTSELEETLDQWGDDARNAYDEAQQSWDASKARQQEIVRHIPLQLGATKDRR